MAPVLRIERTMSPSRLSFLGVRIMRQSGQLSRDRSQTASLAGFWGSYAPAFGPRLWFRPVLVSAPHSGPARLTWDQEPAKPKGMHQTTYDRLVDEWRLAVDAVNEELADRLLRLARTGAKTRRSTAPARGGAATCSA